MVSVAAWRAWAAVAALALGGCGGGAPEDAAGPDVSDNDNVPGANAARPTAEATRAAGESGTTGMAAARGATAGELGTTGTAGEGGTTAGGPDLERGELLALACRACHRLERGAGHAIGPNLYGMFGRRAGALEDFEYSEALAESGIVWTPERLDEWLAAPNDFLPGTTMTFSGYRSEADRRVLIAYLEHVTRPSEGAP